ncbi:ricin-type beta-trefoil lectin domain protein [Actinokineospora sp. HUAS TT18]|uniref:ricin-type beta-trefoil lectin domain protein n=1 Tax=Actinokineospora sp. HUAS TT18 TaxID=3447451 RepID=UPI003F51BB92
MRDDFGTFAGWRTVSGSWQATGGVLRGSGELRRPLCSCSATEELREARASIRFQVPASSADRWASVSVALNGADDRDRLWLTALPYQSTPRITMIRATSAGETSFSHAERGTSLTPGSWYHLELDWRHGVVLARIWADGTARPAAPVAGHVFDALDFHPVAAGIRTYGMPSVDADDFSGTWLRQGPIVSPTAKGSFAPLAPHFVPPPAYDPAKLPRPVIDGNPEWRAMYDKAWSILHSGRIRQPAATSPLVRTYLDEAFDPNIIFQWDTIFTTMFGRYLQPGFDAMGSLDNWYALQEPTGAIIRVYQESDGSVHPWGYGPNGVNPPLFVWAELKSYELTGDLTRVRRVLPALQAYADWVSVSRWSQTSAHQLFWNNGNGNGMDNLPTQPGQGGDGTGTGQVDMSSQLVLMWQSLARLHAAAGDPARSDDALSLATSTAARINQWSWNETDGRYYELTNAGAHWKVDSLAGFWTLVSGVATGQRAQRLAAALADPQRYWTDMVFPALSRSSSNYNNTGDYWRGGVWAPTTYSTIKGLKTAGNTDQAQRSAERYLAGLSEAFGYTDTLWEAYAPERQPGPWITGSRSHGEPVLAAGKTLDSGGRFVSPGTQVGGNTSNWTGGTDNIVKRNFVGWSGLGPIALLIEDIIGIEPDTPNSTIRWRLTRTDRHGIENLSLGTLGKVSLVADARATQAGPVRVCATSTVSRALSLIITDPAGRAQTITVNANSVNQCQTLSLTTTGGTITGPADKCVDVDRADPTNGTAVQLWTCNGGANQRWSRGANDTLQSLGKCLDVAQGGTAAGTLVQLWDCNGTGAQRWLYRPDRSLINPQSGRCLDAANATANGTRLQIRDCNGSTGQRWTLNF